MALARKQLSDSIGALSKATDALSKSLDKMAASSLTKVDSLAKKTSDDFGKFGKSGKSGGEMAGKGIQKVADVLGEVRAIGADAFAGLSGSLKSLASGNVKGSIDGIVDGIAGMSQALDLLVPGLGQATSALIKFAGGGVTLLYELGERIVDENEKVNELRNAFDALGSRFGETGDSMLEHFDDLASELPQTRAQLAAMAEPLIEAGIQGDKLAQSLRSQSAAAAMLGEHGGHAYASLAQRGRDAQRSFQPLTVSMKDLYSTGLNSNDMAKELGISVDQFNAQLRFGSFNAKQFGDALDNALVKKGAKASQSLLTQTSIAMAKMQEKIGMLFQFSDSDSKKGLNEFGESLNHFSTLFDQSTASGKMLHETLHDIFETVLSKAGKAIGGARVGFKMLEVVWMNVVIAGKPLYKSIGDLNRAMGKSKGTGIEFRDVLSGIASAAGMAAKSMAFLIEGMAKIEKGHQIFEGAVFHGGTVGGEVKHLAGHAAGGVVTGVSNGLATVAPASGEGLASIGRGERIVPARESGGGSRLAIHVAPGAVVISGAQGGGQTIELTEEALSLVFERIAMKQGFAR